MVKCNVGWEWGNKEKGSREDTGRGEVLLFFTLQRSLSPAYYGDVLQHHEAAHLVHGPWPGRAGSMILLYIHLNIHFTLVVGLRFVKADSYPYPKHLTCGCKNNSFFSGRTGAELF